MPGILTGLRTNPLVGALSGAAGTAAARRPAETLRVHMEALELEGTARADVTAITLFESVFYRLAPFADDRLPLVASAIYARQGRQDSALLLAGLGLQMQPDAPEALPAYRLLHARFRLTGRAAEADEVARRLAARFPAAMLPDTPLLPPSPKLAALAVVALEAARIATGSQPLATLLAALELRAQSREWAESACLFEGVWHLLPICDEYWIYFRMAEVYAALQRHDAAILMSALALQIDPTTHAAYEPYRRVFDCFRRSGRPREAAALVLRQRALCTERPLLSEAELSALLAEAGPLPPPPARSVRKDCIVHAAETRAAQDWRMYGSGLPAGLAELRSPMHRPPVFVAELQDAEVLVCNDAVAVHDADGAPCPDLSVGEFPALLRRRLDAMRRGGVAVEHATIEAAVLTGDEFPAPNICHFLLDHATRLLLYRDAGIDLSRVTVLGPALRTSYQRQTADKFGIARWRPTDAPARLRVRRLFVSSNCRHLRHPAHWGSAWAVQGVRGLFDLAPRQPRRRLLVSRADSAYRRLGNEEEIAALLAPFGFETIVPGDLGFAEQIAAFRDATHVVGPHGAGLTNTLFCAPGTHVLEIFPALYGTWAYAVLGGALGLDYASLLGRDAVSPEPEFNDPSLPQARRNMYSNRDVRADPKDIRQWLADSKA